jgi:hypothetical protein
MNEVPVRIEYVLSSELPERTRHPAPGSSVEQ